MSLRCYRKLRRAAFIFRRALAGVFVIAALGVGLWWRANRAAASGSGSGAAGAPYMGPSADAARTPSNANPVAIDPETAATVGVSQATSIT